MSTISAPTLCQEPKSQRTHRRLCLKPCRRRWRSRLCAVEASEQVARPLEPGARSPLPSGGVRWKETLQLLPQDPEGLRLEAPTRVGSWVEGGWVVKVG